MFIAPISFSFAQNRQQKAAKYSNLPRLKALEADTVSFTANYTKAAHHAAQKLRNGAPEKVINPIDEVLSKNVENGTNIADIVESVADSAKDVLKVDKLKEQFKVMLASLIYEPEGKLMVALPSNKNELVALIGCGYHGPAEKAKTFAQSVQILNGDKILGYTGYKPSPANTVEELVDDIGILGLREAILPYIETLNKGRSAYSAEELDQRLNEILHQNYNDNIINAEIIDYFFKLSDKEVPGNIENAFFKRMQSGNINQNGDLSTSEIINIIESCRDFIDGDPYMVEKTLGNGAVSVKKSNKKPVNLIDELEIKFKKEKEKAAAKTKAKAAKAERANTKEKEKAEPKTDDVKPEKVEKAKPRLPEDVKRIMGMKKRDAVTALANAYADMLRQLHNIYRTPREQAKAYDTLDAWYHQKYQPVFNKFATMPHQSLLDNSVYMASRKKAGEIVTSFVEQGEKLNGVCSRVGDQLHSMDSDIIDIKAHNLLIAKIDEQLNTEGVKGKTKLKNKRKQLVNEVETLKANWADKLKQVVIDEAANRQSAVEKGLGDEYEYLLGANIEMNNFKRWEQARQGNDGVFPEETLQQISFFYDI